MTIIAAQPPVHGDRDELDLRAAAQRAQQGLTETGRRTLRDVIVKIDVDERLELRDWEDVLLERVHFVAESRITFDGFRFGRADLVHVDFTNISFANGNFNGTTFTNVSFRAPYENIPDSRPRFDFVGFRGCTVTDTIFKGAIFAACNFKGGTVVRCDFYRAHFESGCIFEGTVLADSSLYRADFTGSDLSRANVVDEQKSAGLLLQEQPVVFAQFQNDPRKETNPAVRAVNLANAQREAAEIYGMLAGLFASRGNGTDEAWAYVRRKRLERDIARHEHHWGRWLGLTAAYLVTGFGESLSRIAATGVTLVVLVTVLLATASDTKPVDSLTTAIGNFFATGTSRLGPEAQDSAWVSLLLVSETAVGIFLIGLFGFVLGNKIRNR